MAKQNQINTLEVKWNYCVKLSSFSNLVVSSSLLNLHLGVAMSKSIMTTMPIITTNPSKKEKHNYPIYLFEFFFRICYCMHILKGCVVLIMQLCRINFMEYVGADWNSVSKFPTLQNYYSPGPNHIIYYVHREKKNKICSQILEKITCVKTTYSFKLLDTVVIII